MYMHALKKIDYDLEKPFKFKKNKKNKKKTCVDIF